LEGKKLLAQDILGEKSQDISNRVNFSGNNVQIPGALIHEIGLSAATKGDQSEPGMVLKIE